jgi:hypothetical protein
MYGNLPSSLARPRAEGRKPGRTVTCPRLSNESLSDRPNETAPVLWIGITAIVVSPDGRVSARDQESPVRLCWRPTGIAGISPETAS